MTYLSINSLYNSQKDYSREKEGALSLVKTIPIIGTIFALSNILIKACSIKSSTDDHYFELIRDTSYFNLIVLTIPIIGNVFAAFIYYKRITGISEKANALSKLSNLTSVQQFFDEQLKSWEKAAVATKAIRLNPNIYKLLPKQVQLRYRVAIKAMEMGVPEDEIRHKSRRDQTLILTAIYRRGIHLKYALEASDVIVECYLQRRRDYSFCRGTDPQGQLRNLPIQKLEKLIGLEYFRNPETRRWQETWARYNLSVTEILDDLGAPFIQNLNYVDQKRLLSKIIWENRSFKELHKILPSYFSCEALQQFVTENESTVRNIGSKPLIRILDAYRSSASSSETDKTQSLTAAGPELETEYS